MTVVMDCNFSTMSGAVEATIFITSSSSAFLSVSRERSTSLEGVAYRPLEGPGAPAAGSKPR